jgi:1-acyl-sn-glycerol-3-phosphate acyltransferase
MGEADVAHARVIPLHGTGTPDTGPAKPGADPGPVPPAPRRRPRPLTETHPRAARPDPVAPEPPEPADTTDTAAAAAEPAEADRRADLVEFVRRRIAGEYEVDEFGFDQELTDRLVLPPLRQLYRRWFRVDVLGADHLPVEGGALLVANHSGTLPLDAVMTSVAVHDNTADRHLRMLGADLVFRTPVVGSFARKSGQTLACNADAERLLRGGELVGVWPEGFKGIGKPFRDRYKLQRFGRGGFVSAALRTGVPIIPCSIVGAEEIYPKIADLKPLARLFGFPYFPVTPTFPWLGPLGAVPLPSKWFIEFGEPIRTDGFGAGAEEDPMLVFNLTDQVRETIQQTLYRLLSQRRNAFLG